MALCSLERLPPRARNSGIWESPELDRNPEEEASGTEAAGSYKVVRKGKTNVYTAVEVDTQLPRIEASLPHGSVFWKPSVQSHAGSQQETLLHTEALESDS